MMKQSPKKSPLQKYVDAGFNWLNGVYGRALDWTVHHRKVTVLGAVIVFLAVVIGVGSNLKTEFFPTQDNARISIDVQLPVGTRQEITRDLALRIDQQFREKYPEIKTIGISEGVADTDNTFAAIQDNGTHRISVQHLIDEKDGA